MLIPNVIDHAGPDDAIMVNAAEEVLPLPPVKDASLPHVERLAPQLPNLVSEARNLGREKGNPVQIPPLFNSRHGSSSPLGNPLQEPGGAISSGLSMPSGEKHGPVNKARESALPL